MKFWKDVLTHLERGEDICLLYVVDSVGSSPGRQAFKMFVAESGYMNGSVGGGFMEHKLVELAKSKLKLGERNPFLKQQIHRKEAAKNKSGMICSGEQTIAFYFPEDVELVRKVAAAKDKVLMLTENGISLLPGNSGLLKSDFVTENDGSWCYREKLNYQDEIFIVGGGHVGFALSQTMHLLGFKVTVIDDRDNLNTMEENTFASQKVVVDYDQIDSVIPEGDNIYVVLVSFGFKTDEQVLRKIIRKNFKYLGMMGSKRKIEELYSNMLTDGYSQEEIDRVHAPIGVEINSKTTQEIAISIAAEIIKVKNS